MRILVVEDEMDLAKLACEHLERQSFVVDAAYSVDEALAAVAVNAYDVVMLDLNLPDGDGLDVLRYLRGQGRGTPILAATARDELDQRINGLDQGLDDYLVKPYDLREVSARIRALLRRPGQAMGTFLSCGNLALNTVTMAVSIGGESVVLGRRLVMMLECMLRSVGRVVSRNAIEDSMYGIDDLLESNALEANISRLRRALNDHDATASIHTVRGVGYMLAEVKKP